VWPGQVLQYAQSQSLDRLLDRFPQTAFVMLKDARGGEFYEQ
jgi:hypothetical protein